MCRPAGRSSDSAHFNSNGCADLLWRDTDGDLAIWFMNGTQTISHGGFRHCAHQLDDRRNQRLQRQQRLRARLFWRNTDGDVAIWQINGTQILAAPDIGNVPTSWTIAGTGDFSGTGATDILWRGPTATWRSGS